MTLIRIDPGDAEYGETLSDKIADQRVGRGEVEHVVLHDPGWNDQERFGLYEIRSRVILDEFHQIVAVDHLAGRDGNVASRLEGYGPIGCQMGCFQYIASQITETPHEIRTALFESSLEDFRVGQREVARRKHVQNLPGVKFDQAFVLGSDTGNTRSNVVPPLLRQQEGLGVETERKLFPGFRTETAVGGQGLYAACRFPALKETVGNMGGKSCLLAEVFSKDLLLLAGRNRQMHRPVLPGLKQANRRDAQCQGRYRCMMEPVGNLIEVLLGYSGL